MKLNIIGEVWDLQEQCAALINANEDVELVINSPGGSVFEGLQMVHAIQDCQHKVTARIEVMAASIAAVVALACDAVQIDKNSLLMLHNCWTFTAGNKEELQQEIDAMAAIDTIIHNIVEEHCSDDTIDFFRGSCLRRSQVVRSVPINHHVQRHPPKDRIAAVDDLSFHHQLVELLGRG